jgi:hypothetical protein
MIRLPPARTLVQGAIAVAGLALVVILAANIIAFITSRNQLPPHTRLADVDISRLTTDQAISKTLTALQQPVALKYQDNIIPLQPESVGFQMNEVVARLQLEQIIRRQQGLDKLPAFVFGQQISATHLSTPYQYSESKLQSVLTDIARQYDRTANASVPDISSLRVTPGQDGAALSLDEAPAVVLSALASGLTRTVELPVDVIPRDTVSVRSLEPLVRERLKEFSAVEGNIAGVFIKDLKTGDELAIDADVAFSAPGWLKLASMFEAIRASGEPTPQQLLDHLSTIAAQGDISATNNLLQQLGGGDAQGAIDQMNATLNKLGLRSTFLAQPFGQPTTPPTFITPANSRGDINASPDPNAQSTPAEAGVLLETIRQCREGGGALPLVFPDQFNANKCGQLLQAIGQNKVDGLIAAGSGSSTVVERQSWDEKNHGSAALVLSPDREYVIAVMLHGKDNLNWPQTSSIIADIARLTYALFNEEVPPAVAPLGGPPASP